jgi:hypothetical protein
MHDDLLHRICLAILVLAGVLCIALPPWEAEGLGLMEAALVAGGELAAQARYQRFLLDLVGVGLVLSAFLPMLRPAAIGAGVLSKLAYLALAWGSAPALPLALEATGMAALLGVALVLGRQALREARWHGGSALGGEG